MSDTDVQDANDPPDTTVNGDQVTAREILVEVGGSTADAAALVCAAEQSQATGAPMRILYAWHLSAEPAGAASPSFWVASAADARARATRWVLDSLGSRAASLRWTLEVIEGPPGPMTSPTAREDALELSSQPGGSV